MVIAFGGVASATLHLILIAILVMAVPLMEALATIRAAVVALVISIATIAASCVLVVVRVVHVTVVKVSSVTAWADSVLSFAIPYLSSLSSLSLYCSALIA